MKLLQVTLLSAVVALLVMVGCKKETDSEPPKIELISPLNCDSVMRGEFMHFEATFSDNEELLKYVIDFTENFDHKAYISGGDVCTEEPDKTPFNPFKYVTEENFPPGQTEYTAKHDFVIPESVDTGDYLFVVYAQDKKGLQSFYSVSVKIVTDERK